LLIVRFEKRSDFVRIVEQPDPLFFVESDGESAETVNRESAFFADLQTQLTRSFLLNLLPQRFVLSLKASQLLLCCFFCHNPSDNFSVSSFQFQVPGSSETGNEPDLLPPCPKNKPLLSENWREREREFTPINPAPLKAIE